jgi:hypothetical protein
MSGKERKMRLDGSAPVTIADGGSANGADWTVHNEIVSGATLSFSGLGRVNAAGGVIIEFTRTDTAKREKQHVWPIAFPDGKYVAFAIWYGTLESSRIAVTSLDDGRVRELGIKGATRPAWRGLRKAPATSERRAPRRKAPLCRAPETDLRLLGCG